ncbi:MAG TPA: protein translocase subunit SecD [Steroidobacteraceae bacterium]|nr:protein translocase subunit SecD [Steroidobacteraceae bacterium]
MLEYARWKYILVALVLILAVVFALPTVFGQSLALQVARKDRAPMDVPAQQAVEKVLTEAKVPFARSAIESGRLTLQFEGVPEQLKARDVVTQNFSQQYITALSLASRAPEFFGKIGLRPMPLGLDLRGGLYLLYQVDVSGAIGQVLEGYEQSMRRALADAKIPFVDVAAISVDSDRPNGVRVTLAPNSDPDAVRALLSKTVTDLTLTTVTLSNGPAIQGVLTQKQVRERQDYAIQKNIETLRNRVSELGVSEPVVQRQGLDRINVQLPGVQNSAEVKDILGKVATLEWRLEDTQNDPFQAAQRGRAPLGSKLYYMREGKRPVLLKRDIIVTGDQLTDAKSAATQEGPGVSIRLDARGGDEMLKTTRANVGRRMGVVFIEKSRETTQVDGKPVTRDVTTQDVISNATIKGIFGNQFQITGLQAGEARELALLLRAGSLAAPIYVIEERAVGPSLGQENITKGVNALIIGMAGVFLFMAVYYKAFGLVADVVLLANVILLTALLSLMRASLSLPGIAGIILTVGMAVDANVLIYERIREELRNGVSPQAAIRAGFEKAFSAIADSNITTLIAGIVLWVFGTGPIRGFAIVLTLGIGTSLFTSLMGSRALLTLFYGGRRKLAKLSI